MTMIQQEAAKVYGNINEHVYMNFNALCITTHYRLGGRCLFLGPISFNSYRRAHTHYQGTRRWACFATGHL